MQPRKALFISLMVTNWSG